MNTQLLGVMVFYSLLSYFLFPYLGYLMGGNSHVGTGLVLGSIVSVALWYSYGRAYL